MVNAGNGPHGLGVFVSTLFGMICRDSSGAPLENVGTKECRCTSSMMRK